MTEAGRAPFIEEAEKLRQMHQLEYPDYKYRPKKRQRSGPDDKADKERRDKRCLTLDNQDRKKLKLKEEVVYSPCYQLPISPSSYGQTSPGSYGQTPTSPGSYGQTPISPGSYGQAPSPGLSYASNGQTSETRSSPLGKVPSSPFSQNIVSIYFGFLFCVAL